MHFKRKHSFYLLLFFLLLNTASHSQDLRKFSITSEPAGAEIYINNEVYGYTPNIVPKVHAGRYTIQLKKEGYLDWISNYEVTLADSNYIHAILVRKTGILKIDCDIMRIPVYLDEKFFGRTPQTIRDIEFGKHTIKVGIGNIYRKGKMYSAYRDTIEIDDTAPKEIYVNLGSGWISVTSPQSGILAAIDGDKIGLLPINDLNVENGSREIELSKEGFETKSVDVQITGSKYHSFEYRLEPLSYLKTLTRSLIFPGWGQYYSDNTLKAALFSVVEIGTIAGAFIWDGKLDDVSKEYDDIRERYLNSIDPLELAVLNKKLKKKYDKIEEYELTRNILIGAAILNWAVNIVDAHFIGKQWQEFHSERSISLNTHFIDSAVSIEFNYTF